MSNLARGCIAEFLGTFGFVFLGCLSIIMAQPGVGPGSLVTVALCHGLALGVFVTACMYVSGGQLNPAVSIGLVVAGKQAPAQAAAFILAQLLGAACAAGMIVAILGSERANHESVRLGATIGSLTVEGKVGAVLALEAILSLALMMAVLMGTVDARASRLGGFTIGLTVTACILAAGPLTGASMNPARTFGPALYGHWDMHWAYWVAPVLGACAGALVYRLVWAPHAEA